MFDGRKRANKSVRKIIGSFVFLMILSVFAFGQNTDEDDEDYISPVRPTVSDSATIQKKGVLQIENGGDFDFRSSDFRDEQANRLGVYFAADKRLRLDFEIDTVVSQKDSGNRRKAGIGDVNLGFKTIVRDDPKKRLAVAFAYSIKLPSASEEKNLGTGKIDHTLRLIFDRTYGKTDFIFNAAYLNDGRDDANKRESGAQVDFTVERELSKRFDADLEIYGNTIAESQPRGIYLLGALIYKINKRVNFDVGVRPGFGRDAPKFGFFAGFSVGVANLYGRR